MHDGDEPDMNKYYTTRGPGGFDTPIMKLEPQDSPQRKLNLVLDISGSRGP